MGCGYMAPFYNLLYHCEQLLEGTNSDALNYSQFDSITPDLADANGGLAELVDRLRRIRTNIRKGGVSQMDEISKEALELHRIFCELAKIYFPTMG